MKLYRTLARMVVIVVSALVLATKAEAQTTGRMLDSGTFEFGFTRRWFKRNVEPNFNEPISWGTKVFYVQYGATSWLTLSIEGRLSLGHEHDPQYPGRDYRDLLFGGGIAATVFSLDEFQMLAILHYGEIFSFDRSLERHHKQVQSVLAGIEVQRRFVFSPVELVVTAGPVFVYDEVSDYAPREDYTRKSIENIGVVVGLDVVAFDHARLFGQFIFDSFWQPRIGMGYIF